MKKTYLQKGFTLIELLVVIAIIGILSSVVLASLSTARNKGKDAAIQSQLSAARSQAELYYSTTGNNTYGAAGVTLGNCTTASANIFGSDANSMKNLIDAVVTQAGGAANTACVVPVGGAGYAVSAKLPSGAGYYCVDSTGVSRSKTSAGADYNAVSGASPAAITASTCN